MTAREQEHVAKMTGGPLIQVGERSKTPDPSIGLIGAIEAREQEKRNMRQGVAGHMVKEAIAQRQAAERNYGYQQYPPYGYAMDSRQSGQGIYPQSPSPSPPSQMHQPWTDHQFYQNQSPAQMQQTQLLQRRQSQMDRSRLSGYYSSSGGYGTR
jgi:CCR4-NOT transcriptional complex subunit CAF120